MGVYPNEARVQSLDTSAACITRDWAAACQRTLGNLIRQLMSYFLIAPHHQHCTSLMRRENIDTESHVNKAAESIIEHPIGSIT